MENIITLQEILTIIGIAIAISGVISKISMQYIEERISKKDEVIKEKMKQFNDVERSIKDLDNRIDKIEDCHVDTQISLAKISKDIEYIKSEHIKMALDIRKILDNKCN
ncbi:MAG: hypothetical protein PHN89_02760 [Candidatus Pacebacteria bacterium]|nr:hypothetical protein [Candidatus Paceibacterota bacterium]